MAETWAKIAASNLGYSGPDNFDAHMRWLDTNAQESGDEDGVTDEVNFVLDLVEDAMKKRASAKSNVVVAKELVRIAKLVID